MAVSAKQVAELRARTGAGMMDCKRALEESGGDLDKAAELLREWGRAAAVKKSGRETSEGLVHAYIHGQGRIGVLIEVNCETDFVAATDDFKHLVHELAMQVAATAPEYVRREDVPAEVVERERELLRRQAEAEGKPPAVVEKMVEGRLNKFFSQVCLEDQPYIRDDSITVGELIHQAIAKLGENIRVRRFVRYELGSS